MARQLRDYMDIRRLLENTMRSDLVFGAMKYVSNRYLLVRLTAKATRKFHRPHSRIVETTNDVLVRFSQTDPLAQRVFVDRFRRYGSREAA
jgi:hypothetical protein